MERLFHGDCSRNDPNVFPCVCQGSAMTGTFEHLFDMSFVSLNDHLTNSPTCPLVFKVNPLLVPESDSSVHVGNGPTANICVEHLEMASLTGKEKDKFITGCTLHWMALKVAGIIRKVDAIAPSLLHSDGEFPSGKDPEDFLYGMVGKSIKANTHGQFNFNIENPDKPTLDNSSGLNQNGAFASSRLSAKVPDKSTTNDEQSKWPHKMIPVSGWFAIAPFVKKGIAQLLLEDSLRLLKEGNCAKVEKKKPSCIAVHEKIVEDKLNDRKQQRPKTFFNKQDHLLTNAMNLMAEGEGSQEIKEKQIKVKNLNSCIKCQQWMTEQCSHLGKNAASLLDDCFNLLEEAKIEGGD